MTWIRQWKTTESLGYERLSVQEEEEEVRDRMRKEEGGGEGGGIRINNNYEEKLGEPRDHHNSYRKYISSIFGSMTYIQMQTLVMDICISLNTYQLPY